MNPQDHSGRNSSPFIDYAESTGVVDDVHVLDATPVRAGEVAGAVPFDLVPARRVPVLFVVAAVMGVVSAATIAAMTWVGGAL